MKKRDFIKLSLLGAASCTASPLFASNSKSKHNTAFEALPIAENIHPKEYLFTDFEIAEHHKLYFEKPANYLNKLNLKGRKSRKIFLNSNQYKQETVNNAGAFYNHRMFFKTISDGGNHVDNTLLSLIKSNFGSFNSFIGEFNQMAISQDKNGWIWLINTPDGLKIIPTLNNDNPLMSSLPSSKRGFPLIAMDNWEHAYINSGKQRYIDNFWKSVNWDYIATRYKRAKTSNLF